ncbi:MAG: glycine cleavage system protein GcvH [Balneolaceae bacterium]
MNLPKELKYTREHEWVRDHGDGTATVGITDFAQGELGDVVFVELEDVGVSLEPDDVFGTVEAVKTVSELFAPLQGEILEINEQLEKYPELVNNDPYGDGWMIKMSISDQDSLDELLSADDYQEIVD